MDLSQGDIVVIDYHPISELIGRVVEVVTVTPSFLGGVTWYVIIEVTGEKHAAAHPWLRRMNWDEVQALLRWREVLTEA